MFSSWQASMVRKASRTKMVRDRVPAHNGFTVADFLETREKDLLGAFLRHIWQFL